MHLLKSLQRELKKSIFIINKACKTYQKFTNFHYNLFYFFLLLSIKLTGMIFFKKKVSDKKYLPSYNPCKQGFIMEVLTQP